MSKRYEHEAAIKKVPDIDGAYIKIPFDAKVEFGRERVPVMATFDGEPYDGILVRMGAPCHMIGIRKTSARVTASNRGTRSPSSSLNGSVGTARGSGDRTPLDPGLTIARKVLRSGRRASMR